ncbi:YbjN domain-containing protein [Actinomyces faecalis]|uniref:YbjN domain-containing protein n=1 Tax=Actinomyces faecalis TaxID=2722820 RepID=UPI001554605E|nr:YbjN domain-containing protein [Actinomyces faecalis]
MSLFSRSPGHVPQAPGPAAGSAQVLAPLSQDRLVALFKERDWRYFIDSDGDLGGMWDDATFYFTLAGEKQEVLRIWAQLPGTVDATHLEQVRTVLDASHRRSAWPTASYRIDDDGEVRVFASHAVDYEYGLSDLQLAQHVDCAIATVNGLFADLNEVLGR